MWYESLYKNATQHLKSIVAGTIEAAGMQLSAIPKLATKIFNDTPIRSNYYNILHYIGTSTLAMVAVKQIEKIYLQFLTDYQSDDESPFSTYTLLLLQTPLLFTAALYYRQSIEACVRRLMLMDQIHATHNDYTPIRCTHDKSPKTFLDNLIYRSLHNLLTDLLIVQLARIPAIGPSTSNYLSIQQNGRYVVSLLNPNLCNEDLQIYLKRHSGWVMGLGITQFMSTWIIARGLENYLYISKSSSFFELQSLIMMLQFSLLHFITLPPLDMTPQHQALDPVSLYQSAITEITSTLIIGLQKKIPEMLKNPSSPIDWKAIYNQIDKFLTSTRARKIRFLLPKMFHSIDNLKHDRYIEPNWGRLRTNIISSIEAIEKLSKNEIVQLATAFPKSTTKIIKMYYGIDKLIIKSLISIFSNQKTLLKLTLFKQQLMRDTGMTVPDGFVEAENTIPFRDDLIVPETTAATEKKPDTTLITAPSSLPQIEPQIIHPLKPQYKTISQESNQTPSPVTSRTETTDSTNVTRVLVPNASHFTKNTEPGKLLSPSFFRRKSTTILLPTPQPGADYQPFSS